MSPTRNKPGSTCTARSGISKEVKKLAVILVSASLFLPLVASAQATTPPTTPSGAAYQYQRQGIFDCNQNGAYAMSVGALSAIGGAYVPVADAAVELNTGTLVYKECVLREVVDHERESALSALLQQITIAIERGRNGNAMYVKEPPSVEIVRNATDPAILAVLQGNTLQASPFRTTLQYLVAKLYQTEVNAPQTYLTCPIQNNLDGLTHGALGTFNWNDFNTESNPACYALGAAGIAETLATDRLSQAESDLYLQWLWGRGYYPRYDANGNVVTPAANVEELYLQLLESPVVQMENANDIGQMVGALYAGVTTQVVGDIGGLAGITQSVGGQPSYLAQVAAESAAGLQGAATNAALQILNGALQVENAYYQAVNGIGASLLQTKQQLQTAESQCFAAIVAQVCTTSLAADNTCRGHTGPCTTDANGNQTCPTPPILKVVTSTAFSQAVIDSQITPLVAPAAANIQSSKTALQLIGNLVQGVTNTTSLDAQRVALQQEDTLVTQHKLHTPTDLATVTQQQGSVANAMSSLLQRVVGTWSGTGQDGSGNIPWDGTTNPGNGWCNLNNPGTIAAWTQRWTQ